MTVRLIACAVLAIPAGWMSGLLADRVPPMGRDLDNNLRDPSAVALFGRPLPGLRLGGRYLWIQLAVLVTYVGTAYRLAELPAVVTAPYLVWWCGLVALSAVDISDRRLPDRIVLPTFVIGAVVMVVAAVAGGRAVNIRYALIGAGCYFALFLVLNMVYPGLAAFGDVKASGVVGMVVGFMAHDSPEALLLSFWGIFLAFIASAVMGFVFIVTGGLARARERRVGLGSYVVAAAFVIVMAAPALVGQ